MDKLTTVRDALEANPDIVIVDVRDYNYIPERDGYWSHTVDFIVAPKKGIYSADKLQELMITLVPALNPTTTDKFRQWDWEMAFGKLYFDEEVGTEEIAINRKITLTDEKLFSMEGFQNGQRTIEVHKKEPLRRRTWVRLYPNVEIALLALKGIHEHNIPPNELRKWKYSRGGIPRLLQKVLGK